MEENTSQSVSVKPDLRGSLDFVADGRLYGCAWDQGNPGRTVEVEVFAGDSSLGRAKADAARPDLKMAGVGDGRHGFVFALPPAINAGTLSASICDSDFDLAKGPFIAASLANRTAASDKDILRALSVLGKRMDKLSAKMDALGTELPKAASAGFGEVGGRLSALAERKDLVALDKRMTPRLQSAVERIQRFESGLDRIEGYLNIGLGERLRDVAAAKVVPVLREDIDKLRGRLNAVIYIVAIGVLIAAVLAVLPSDWLSLQLPGSLFPDTP